MRRHLLGLVLVAGLVGCTSESDPLATASPGDVAGQAQPAPGPSPASLAATRGSAQHFASLPDRGELLSYGGARKTRQSGAYTYHPVAISEAHALNAIGSGEMAVNLPGGETLRLAYERHEEQPDGNWTWIGRGADGSSAVLTFGEKAVFGMVSRGEDYFRVRTDRAGAWVVETDRSRAVAGGKRGSEPDFLVPPENAMAVAAASRRTAKAGVANAVPGKAVAVVDVLIGYSNGLASAYGSQSAASTFVTSLVALTNSAYANSGVNMRLRAVHTLQVSYADTSSNRDTLQQLTGYNVDTQQPITPNSAFNALRAARDEYGADLVAFVRRYREPEQNGCGIAWLLGMNQSGISAAADADFGYAVVSDGEDRDEGDNNTYFCSDFSLAHELGHLMGQAHNSQDAGGDSGAHAYSYGYREASATGFYTIMAYPGADTQVEIPNFANPKVNVVGRPTGVANQSDNVRSMNQTMPIVSQFRATVVPLANLRNDFDGDGKADVFFRNVSSGRNVIWKGANYDTRVQEQTVSSSAWKVVGTGDFNGDGKADVLWRNTSTGANMIWRGGAYAQRQNLQAVTNQAWEIVGVGDFNGDGVSDILWRHRTNGKNMLWLSGNGNTRVNLDAVEGGGWSVAGIGDFNGDGRDDILWRSATSGKNTIWKNGNGGTRQSVDTVDNLNWKIAGVGDFNGDGVDDILWRNSKSGDNKIWLSANGSTRQPIAGVNTKWFVAAVADYDGDGRDDILWRHSADGRNIIWKAGNTDTRQAMKAVAGSDWRIYY